MDGGGRWAKDGGRSRDKPWTAGRNRDTIERCAGCASRSSSASRPRPVNSRSTVSTPAAATTTSRRGLWISALAISQPAPAPPAARQRRGQHCLTLQPSGPVTAGDYGLAGLANLDVTSNITIYTDNGSIIGPPTLSRSGMTGVVNGIGFHVVSQSGGPSVGVFSVAGLTSRQWGDHHGQGRQCLRARLGWRGHPQRHHRRLVRQSDHDPGPWRLRRRTARHGGGGPLAGAGKAGTDAARRGVGRRRRRLRR